MNAHQRRKAFRLGVRLLRTRAPVRFKSWRTGYLWQIARVVCVDSNGLCELRYFGRKPEEAYVYATQLRRVGGI